MSILAWLAVGAVIGLGAFTLLRRPIEDLASFAFVGITGALLSGVIASATFGLDLTELQAPSIFISAAGATALVAVLQALPGSEPYA